MGIGSHKTEFAGQKIIDYDPAEGLTDLTAAYRLSLGWQETDAGEIWLDLFAKFLAEPQVSQLTGFILGAWGEMIDEEIDPLVEALAGAHLSLPHLTTLFVADMTSEESEISWIPQTDLSPLFLAYPNLRHFGARGSQGLRLGYMNLPHLETLVIETGGLPDNIVHEIFSSALPNLTHLELWLGTERYGGQCTAEDFAPLLSGQLFPKLRYLGLRDSEIVDELAGLLVNSPLLPQLEVLDLSLGTMSDLGAQVFIDNPAVLHLKKLDLHHHYITPELQKQLKQLPLEVDVRDPQTLGRTERRFVAVGE